jgi:hypothetical protein
VREVRELYGIVAGAGARRGVLVTCGGYTAEATAFAKVKPLDLFVSKEEWTARRCLRCCWKPGIEVDILSARQKTLFF